MAVKPIRPDVTIEPVEAPTTPDGVKEIIDRLQAMAEGGCISALAVAYVEDGSCACDYFMLDDEHMSLLAIVRSLELRVAMDATFEDEE